MITVIYTQQLRNTERYLFYDFSESLICTKLVEETMKVPTNFVGSDGRNKIEDPWTST